MACCRRLLLLVYAAAALTITLSTLVQANASHWPRRTDLPQQRANLNCTTAACRVVGSNILQRDRRLAAIKRAIKALIGMKDEPQLGDKNTRQSVIDKFNRTNALQSGQSRILSIAERVTNKSGNEQGGLRFVIKPENIEGHLRVTGAHLNVLVRCRKRTRKTKRSRPKGRRIKLKIYDLDNNDDGSNGLMATHEVVIRHTNWQKLLIPTTVVQEVIDSGRRDMRLRIECEKCTKSVRPIIRGVRIRKPKRSRQQTRTKRDSIVEHQRQRQRKKAGRHSRRRRKQNKQKKKLPRIPYMEVNFTRQDIVNLPRRLYKRHADCQCCVRRLYADFAQLGLKQVVQPSGFYANYCTNQCGQSTTVTQANEAPLCRSRTTKSLKMVYIDKDGNAVKTELPNMKIEDCACAGDN